MAKSFSHRIAAGLTAAFLAGPFEQKELLKRGTKVLGKRRKWLARLVEQLVQEFGEGKQLSRRTLDRFILANAGFQKTCEENQDLTLAGLRHFPPRMMHDNRAAPWLVPPLNTPEQLAEQIQMFAKSEKDGAVVEHMLYELLLKFGQELTTLVETLDVADGKVFAIHQRKMLFVLDTFTEAMIQPLVDIKPREIIAIDGVFHDSDTLKTNLDLQCRDAGIKFTCI